MKTSEVLNTAADLIESRGWATGPEGWHTGDKSPLCLEGGIMAVMGFENQERDDDKFRSCAAYKAVSDYLAIPYHRGLYVFNDEATKERVLEVLRAVAVIEAAKEEALDKALEPVLQ